MHYGCELHLTLESIENALRFPSSTAINHRGYLLVEFSDFLMPEDERDSGPDDGPGVASHHCASGAESVVAGKIAELEAWVGRGARCR